MPDRMKKTADLVIEDMQRRAVLGLERYGVPLQPLNGRSSLQDAYEEAQDLCFYLKNEIEERKRDERWFQCAQIVHRIYADHKRTGSWEIAPDVQEWMTRLLEDVAKALRLEAANS
jgi:hypothetical protein